MGKFCYTNQSTVGRSDQTLRRDRARRHASAGESTMFGGIIRMHHHPARVIWQRHWPELLAVACAVLVLSEATWVIKTIKSTTALSATAPSITALPVNAIDDLANTPWLGRADSNEPIQTSAIPLVLVGTLASTHLGQGYALIGTNANQIKVYAPKDALPGGAILESVYADHVNLNNNQHRESLSLPRTDQTALGINPPNNSAQASAKATTFGPAIQKIQKEPTLLAEVLKPMPQFENGRLKGFKAFPGADKASFDKLGLRAGDLITQVNNVPFVDTANGLEMLKSLSGAQTATVTVDRGGVLIPITIDASNLAALATPSGNPASAPTQGPATRPSLMSQPHPTPSHP